MRYFTKSIIDGKWREVTRERWVEFVWAIGFNSIGKELRTQEDEARKYARVLDEFGNTLDTIEEFERLKEVLL